MRQVRFLAPSVPTIVVNKRKAVFETNNIAIVPFQSKILAVVMSVFISSYVNAMQFELAL